MSRTFRILLWYLCLPAFLLVLVYPPKIHGYLNPYDEGLWLGLAQALIEGKIPYQDVFFHYGPVIPWVLRFVLHHVTPTLFSSRMVFWILNAAALLLVQMSLLRVVRSGFLRLALSVSLWSVPLAAHVLTIPMAARYGMPFASILCWTFDKENDRRTLWAVYSGMLAALAFWVSQEVGAAVMIAGLVYFSLSRRRMRIAQYLLGSAGVSLLVMLGLGADGIHAYWQCAVSETATIFFRNALPFSGWGGTLLPEARQGLVPFVAALRSYATTGAAVLPTISYAVVFAWTIKSIVTCRPWDRFALALALYGSLNAITTWTQPDRWHIYFALSPALLLWGHLVQIENQHRAKAVMTGFVVVVSLFLTCPHAFIAQEKSRFYIEQMRRSTIERAGISRLPDRQAEGYEALVQEINRLIPREQEFVFYPYDGSIYFLTNRTNPTFFPVLALAVNAAMQQRIINDMSNPAVQWVVQDTEDNAFKGMPIDTFLAPIDGYIKSHFVLKASLGPFRFLRRDSGNAAGRSSV